MSDHRHFTVLPSGSVFKLFRQDASHPEVPLDRAVQEARDAVPHHAIRIPHHTAPKRCMLGSLKTAKGDNLTKYMPGELGLVHGGVLILDDLSEWPRSVIALIGRVFAQGMFRLSDSNTETDVIMEIPSRFAVYATQPAFNESLPAALRDMQTRRTDENLRMLTGTLIGGKE